MAFEDGQCFLEEFHLAKLIRVFGFDTTIQLVRGLSTSIVRREETYPCRSLADRLDKTVFPMSTINFKIRWFSGSESVTAVLNISCDRRLSSGSRLWVTIES